MTSEILANLFSHHKEAMNVIKSTYGFIAASFIRWHGDDEAVIDFKDGHA